MNNKMVLFNFILYYFFYLVGTVAKPELNNISYKTLPTFILYHLELNFPAVFQLSILILLFNHVKQQNLKARQRWKFYMAYLFLKFKSCNVLNFVITYGQNQTHRLNLFYFRKSADKKITK